MARIIDDRTSTDLTVKIFDDFYSFNMVVNGNEFDIVNGYFKTVCATRAIAGNFTAFLFTESSYIFLFSLPFPFILYIFSFSISK